MLNTLYDFPTKCMIALSVFAAITDIVSIHYGNWLVFVMKTSYVSCEVGPELLAKLSR